MYEFDLVYSEDLGKREYSDRVVHCCFNIYKKPSGQLNSKPDYKLKDIGITEVRLNNKTVEKYDFKIIAWGAGVGRLLNSDEHYAKEFYITVNREELKGRVLKVLQTVNWIKEYAMTATPNLLQWQVCKYLKEQIPELNYGNKTHILWWSQTLINKGFQDLKISKSPKLSKNPRKSRIFGEVLKRGT